MPLIKFHTCNFCESQPFTKNTKVKYLWIYSKHVRNKMIDFSYKGECGGCGCRIRNGVFKRRVGLSYR